MMKISATLLILSSVLHVKAIPGVIHKDINIVGCATERDANLTLSNSDKESMFGLDGEVKFYVDFTKVGKMEMPQPTFIDPLIPDPKGTYSVAYHFQTVCGFNLKRIRKAYNNPPVELEPPDHSLYPREQVVVGVANTLICHVTGFYPAPVNISWTRNTLNLTDDITDDITTSVPYPNSDWTFTQISTLKFTPEQGDIYSCTVNHQSLSSPETRFWDVEQDQPSVGPDVFCGVGLTLGLLGVAMGTFFLIKGLQCN